MEKWYVLSREKVLKELDVDKNQGLTGDEVKRRREKHGLNEIKGRKTRSPLQMFIDQFKDVLIIILLNSAVIAGFLGEFTDSIVIAIILIINAILGVVQEHKAEKSLEALKEMAAPEALVLRQGEKEQLPTAELVPGDIVFLKAGDYIPADLRLVESSDLKVEESILTGESVPVEKDTGFIDKENPSLGEQKNMVFMGTNVTAGNARGVVVATAMDTEMGKIAGMLDTDEREPTPLQKRLNEMGKKIGFIILIIVAAVILAGLLRGIPFLEIFMTGIALAVAAVPEGLPAVVTIVLALGVQRMIERHAIIRRLPAVETLGAITVICSDKTGTLTQNEMTVKTAYLPGVGNDKIIEVEGEGYKPEGSFLLDETEIDPHNNKGLSLLLKASALSNNAQLEKKEDDWKILGDPTEGALIVAAEKAGLSLDKLNEKHPRIKEFPFNSERKRMSTVHKKSDADKGQIVFAKGAPGSIIEICKFYHEGDNIKEFEEKIKEKIYAKNEEFASLALRVLAVAYKPLPSDEINEDGEYQINDIEKDLTFLGLLGMIDPPRKVVAKSVRRCQEAGIRPVVITGDYSLTAKAIAEEVGIFNKGDRVVSGPELEKMLDERLYNICSKTSVYARVSPRHKKRIVKALKANGQVVAMTGDGVNDAPALKEADIGVAMGITGTDVAKEASDMVLTDDNFSSIVDAVDEGRHIYQNIKKFIRFLLSCNIGEVIAIFTAILLGLPSPLIPIQILWINLITDGFPALALGVDPADEDLMKKKPRDPKEGVFAGKMGFNILSQGVWIALITLAAFYIGYNGYGLEIARTMAFAALGFSQLSHSLNSRSIRYSILKIGFASNRYLLLALLVSGLLMAGVMFIPPIMAVFEVAALKGTQWLIVIGLALSPLVFVEILKVLGVTYEKK